MPGSAAPFKLQGQKLFTDRGKARLAHIVGLALHHDAKAGFHRGMLCIKLMAVEGHAAFHAQGVAGAKSCRTHTLVFKQGFPQGHGLVDVYIQFVAKLAGIAGAADHQLVAAPGGVAEGKIACAAQILAQELFHDLDGLGALDVNLGSLVGNIGKGEACQAFFQDGKVLVAAGCVDDDHVGIRSQMVDDAVVQDAALLVQDKAVAATAFCQVCQAVADSLHETVHCIRAADQEFAHVADVKNRGTFTGVLVLCQNAFILDGHVPAGKGGHLGAMLFMPAGQGRIEKFSHSYSFFMLLPHKEKAAGAEAIKISVLYSFINTPVL